MTNGIIIIMKTIVKCGNDVEFVGFEVGFLDSFV